MTATFVKKAPGSYTGDARVYRLSTSVPCKILQKKDPNGPDNYDNIEFVAGRTIWIIVSAVIVAFTGRPETYIFPADEDGYALSHCELQGSFQGGLNHRKALEGLGCTEIIE